MFKWLKNVLLWVLGIWSKLPQSAKDKIIDAIVEVFDIVFRNYFRNITNGEKNE